MKHHNPRIQELVELLHSRLRSFSDRAFIYQVIPKRSTYEIWVWETLTYKGLSITVSYEALHATSYWESAKHAIVHQLLMTWMENNSPPVTADDITYLTEPVQSAQDQIR